jgi:hypothetical protein
MEENKNISKEEINVLTNALVETGRRMLEHDVALYTAKRANGNIIMMGYYKKKLYQAILALRAYNKENKPKDTQ